jgi:hypothetical protein
MPEMSLSEAAKWAGKGRPAILKAIQKGTISARRDDAGQWRIDPAELERVYPPGNGGNVSEPVARSISEPAESREREIALLREIIDDLKKQRDGWQDQAAKWQQQAEAQTRLITHQAQQDEAAEQETAPRKGWLARLVRA